MKRRFCDFVSLHRTKICLMLLGLLVFAFYYFISLFLSYLVAALSLPYLLSSYFSDGLMIVLFGIPYYRLFVRPRKRMSYRFSGYGWTVLIFLFISMYVFSQAMGTLVETWFPSQYMQVYQSMEGWNLVAYLILSITVAPIAEELIFRGFLYQSLRRVFSIPVCVIISSVLFAFVHGTTGHIPVTFALTLFLCLLLELTGQMRYVIGFHMFYNLLGIAYITRVSFTVWQVVLCYFGILAVLMLGLAYRKKVRKIFAVGGLSSVEAYLDAKRKSSGNDVDKS